MKTTDYIKDFKSKKAEVRAFAKSVSFVVMMAQSLANIVPKGWQLKPSYWARGLKLVADENNPVTADVFDKLVAKYAKIFGTEPNMHISETTMSAEFYIHRRLKFGHSRNDWDAYVWFEITTSNTEKCEITYKRKMQKVPILTGYCKVLSEKKYLPEKVN